MRQCQSPARHTRAASRGFGRTPIGATALLLALSLCACGGGDAGETASPQAGSGTGGGTDVGSGQGGGTALPPAPVARDDAFMFEPTAAMGSDQALQAVADGQTLAQGWNPTRAAMLSPGMKVSFFGRANGCAREAVDGPLDVRTAAPGDDTLARMGITTASGAFVRDWQPSGRSGFCDAEAQDGAGPSRVVISAHAHGAIGLATSAAPASQSTFFGAYDAAGQDGMGTNAFNTSSFVTFRMDWQRAARRPWAGPSATARVYSRQSVGAVRATAPEGSTQPVQAKQFVSVAFLNRACAAQGIAAGRPCVVKYLFPLVVAQAGVTDWQRVGWFNSGRVWFDPVQGSLPIVEGAPGEPGAVRLDAHSGQPLFTSAGASAQHAAFVDRAFDIRISFAQLGLALRVVTARQAGTAPVDVSDDQMSATWGAQWNDPAQWVLVSVAVGQEVHNPYAGGDARIGGAFRSLYVGPAD